MALPLHSTYGCGGLGSRQYRISFTPYVVTSPPPFLLTSVTRGPPGRASDILLILHEFPLAHVIPISFLFQFSVISISSPPTPLT